ncbi:Sec-independent protein translocase subunit TatA [Nocardioides sp.]|uniref:Sec-independent protein translocase subunit TatA n=1 Tax=Nocardioides sp. TaxID=35761 RepID=UPI0027292DAB|nr:Sec-independent protein translocase subunit TatA [Nocardioides sp.]MDO9454605.1 Sec-independent protein translocase subunit TatA [Nocardioides sp.]
MINPLIGMPQGAEWLVILAIVILVFGAAKLPDLARGTGQALRIFKNETKGLRDDDDDTKPTPEPTPASEISAPEAVTPTNPAPATSMTDEVPVTPEADVRPTNNS